MYAALDVGGTKIEACLFDHQLNTIVKQRCATPTQSYPALIDALAQQATWLRAQAQQLDVPIGIGIPGVIDPKSGIAISANLPASGHTLAADLIHAIGQQGQNGQAGRITVAVDRQCFALSEAHSGAGRAYSRVVGLIIGTGVGAGLCQNGRIVTTYSGISGEVGHLSLPADLVDSYQLPLWRCGCGRHACFETLLSGPGLEGLITYFSGRTLSVPQFIAAKDAKDPHMCAVFEIWLNVLGELLMHIQLTIDPDCIVIGGGLSNIPDLANLARTALVKRQFAHMSLPHISIAQHGDSSGIRGAALLSRDLNDALISTA